MSPGGYIVVDDFGAVEGCRRAIADYRMEKCIDSPIQDIDGIGAYWKVPALPERALPRVVQPEPASHVA